MVWGALRAFRRRPGRGNELPRSSARGAECSKVFGCEWTLCSPKACQDVRRCRGGMQKHSVGPRRMGLVWVRSRVMRAMDTINSRFGKGAVRVARTGQAGQHSPGAWARNGALHITRQRFPSCRRLGHCSLCPTLGSLARVSRQSLPCSSLGIQRILGKQKENRDDEQHSQCCCDSPPNVNVALCAALADSGLGSCGCPGDFDENGLHGAKLDTTSKACPTCLNLESASVVVAISGK